MSDFRVRGWTNARYWSYIRSALRRAFQRYPNKYKALANSKASKGRYACAACLKEFRTRDVSVDHVVPCGSLKEFDDVGEFVSRLFCDAEGLQVLCHECHYIKTMSERGFSKLDLLVLEFKKLPAKKQRDVLASMFIEPESNQDKRVKQYEKQIQYKHNRLYKDE